MGAEVRQALQCVQQGQGENMERYFRCIQGKVPRQRKNFTTSKETYPESGIRLQAFKATVSVKRDLRKSKRGFRTLIF